MHVELTAAHDSGYDSHVIADAAHRGLLQSFSLM
jgi:hypothetical protein